MRREQLSYEEGQQYILKMQIKLLEKQLEFLSELLAESEGASAEILAESCEVKS